MPWQRTFLATRALLGEPATHDELQLGVGGQAFVHELSQLRGRSQRAAHLAREVTAALMDLSALSLRGEGLS